MNELEVIGIVFIPHMEIRSWPLLSIISKQLLLHSMVRCVPSTFLLARLIHPTVINSYLYDMHEQCEYFLIACVKQKSSGLALLAGSAWITVLISGVQVTVTVYSLNRDPKDSWYQVLAIVTMRPRSTMYKWQCAITEEKTLDMSHKLKDCSKYVVASQEPARQGLDCQWWGIKLCTV